MALNARTSQILSAAVVMLASGLAALATNPTGVKPAVGRSGAASSQKSAAEAAEVTALRPAFTILLDADHDYDGHRAKAMRAIAEACRLMGTDIVPPGTVKKPATSAPGEKHSSTEPEQQSASDAQLQQALSIVQQVKTTIPAGTQPKITARLEDAITEIGLALGVK